MKAKKIYESLNDILKPKSKEDIINDLNPNVIKIISLAYKEIKNNTNVKIKTPIDFFIDDENLNYYGFKFKNNGGIESFGYYPELISYYYDGTYNNYKIGNLNENSNIIINQLLRKIKYEEGSTHTMGY